jgi:hypothetical protein
VPTPINVVSIPDFPSFTFCNGSADIKRSPFAINGLIKSRWAVPNERAVKNFRRFMFELPIDYILFRFRNWFKFITNLIENVLDYQFVVNF